MVKLLKNPYALSLLSSCGEALPISSSVLGEFVILYIYGNNEVSCEVTSATQWKKMKKKNTQRLMPDKDTLDHICVRANYLPYCQKYFQLINYTVAIGNGWAFINGKCHQVRNRPPVLPVNIT